MSTDLSPAITLLLDYNPHWAYTDFSPVRMWLDEGCDMERDIVPALKACMQKKKDIKGITYFTPAVRKARDCRKDTERARQVIAERDGHLAATADARKAKTVAFLIRKLGKCMPQESRWLREYEAQHGEVQP